MTCEIAELVVGHQESQHGHCLSDLGVATSVLDVACREVPLDIAMLDAVCGISVPLAAVFEDSARQAVVEDSVPHAVVEDSVSHAAAAAEEAEDSVFHAVREDSVSQAAVEDSVPHAVVVEDSTPTPAVVGDSVHADAVFPSVSSDFGSCADLAAANCTSRVGSGDVAVAIELPVVGVGVSGARCAAACRAAVPRDAEQDACSVLAAARPPRAADEHSSVEVVKRASPVWEIKFPKVVPCLDEDSSFDLPLIDVALASATRLPCVGEDSSVEVCSQVLKSKFIIRKFPKVVPLLDEDALLACELRDLASAPATRVPRADEHRSIEVWNPVLESHFFKVCPDVGADPCDDVVPVAACVPELCDARGLFHELVSNSLADDGFADSFLELRSDVAISCCARAGNLERGPGGRSCVPVGSDGGSLEQLDSELILPFFFSGS